MERLSYQNDKIIFCKLANCFIAACNEYAKLHKLDRENMAAAIMANGIVDTMAFITQTDKIAKYIRDFAENGKLIIYEVPSLDTEIVDAKIQVMYSVEDIFDYFYLHH
jgi:hypothetical protein